MQAKVSIIVAVYKAEKYIRRCLDSLVNQTLREIEIILVDDGSPDNSGKICDEYASFDNRIKVFHKENGGVSSARNVGIENATGEYSIHCDPDDYVDLDMYEQMYNKAKEVDADMVICDFNCSVNVTQKEHLEDIMKDYMGSSVWNKLIRHELYKKFNIIYPISVAFGEDLCVVIKFLLHDIKIAYVQNAFYQYDNRINENSICNVSNQNSFNFERLVQTRTALVKELESFVKNTYFEPLITNNKVSLKLNLIASGKVSYSEYKKVFPEMTNKVMRKLSPSWKTKLLFFMPYSLARIIAIVYQSLKRYL